MSRIEEALRRARLAESGEIEAVEVPDPVPAAVVAAWPYLVEDAASEVVASPPPVTFAPRPMRAAELPEKEAREGAQPLPDARADQMRHGPSLAGSRSERLILNPDMPQAVTEQYRKAAASLHQLQLDRGIKIVMIASAVAGEGKTITASNIALTLSESFKRRVLLIDADLRRPSIHGAFGTPNVTGLSDALLADRPEKLTIHEVSTHLSVLAGGRPNPDPMSSLSSERMRTIVNEAAAMFDWVVIDTPPVGLLADAKLLVEMVQAVVLVIGAGQTPFRAIERAVAAIDRKKIAGVILNRVIDQPSGYHDYDYYSSVPAAG
jgi:protein-tyrosine kinase